MSMDFDLFLKNVPKIQNIALPAQESHLKMAPLERARMLNLWDYSQLNPKKAGVMALFYPRGSQTHLILIKRTPRGIHSSQVALPGGKFEQKDIDHRNTAIRETYKENIVDLHKQHVYNEQTDV